MVTMTEYNEFLMEFEDELMDLTIGKLDMTTGTWTELHQVRGYMEDANSSGIWIAGRSQLSGEHRVYLPHYDIDGNEIELDSTMYIVKKRNFDWDTDKDEVLYQVQSHQPYHFYLFATAESTEI